MGAFTCCRSVLKSLSRAAAKSAAARLRAAGLLEATPAWPQRAAICETCFLRTIHNGISYCGTPFLSKVQRVPFAEGCGCPCHDKAKSPDEHCPLDPNNRPATRLGGQCTCKWCEETGVSGKNSGQWLVASGQ